MPNPGKNHTVRRAFALLLMCGPASFLAGCSQDYASVDDVYVPASAEERFPIQVLERPVKLALSASSGTLTANQVKQLSQLASEATDAAASPVVISYPTKSAKARSVAQQAARVLTAQGVPPGKLKTARYDGKSDVVTVAVSRPVAAVKSCGDWSRNLADDASNEPHSNFGCSIQNNIAAMVANPADFERPRNMGPSLASGRMPGLSDYQKGDWVKPPDDIDPTRTTGSSTSSN